MCAARLLRFDEHGILDGEFPGPDEPAFDEAFMPPPIQCSYCHQPGIVAHRSHKQPIGKIRANALRRWKLLSMKKKSGAEGQNRTADTMIFRLGKYPIRTDQTASLRADPDQT